MPNGRGGCWTRRRPVLHGCARGCLPQGGPRMLYLLARVGWEGAASEGEPLGDLARVGNAADVPLGAWPLR